MKADSPKNRGRPKFDIAFAVGYNLAGEKFFGGTRRLTKEEFEEIEEAYALARSVFQEAENVFYAARDEFEEIADAYEEAVEEYKRDCSS